MAPLSRASARDNAAPSQQDAEAKVLAGAVREAAVEAKAVAMASDYTRGKNHLHALSRLTTVRV